MRQTLSLTAGSSGSSRIQANNTYLTDCGILASVKTSTGHLVLTTQQWLTTWVVNLRSKGRVCLFHPNLLGVDGWSLLVPLTEASSMVIK